MANLKQFKLPDLGEGLTEGEILRWLVRPGDTVTLNQPIVEVETAKAAVEVPSPYAGVVRELHYGEGALVDVGVPIITVDTEPGSNGAGELDGPLEVPGIPAALMAHPPDDGAIEPGLIGGAAPGGRTSVLVGYGPKSVTAARRPRKTGPAVGPTLSVDPPPARVSAAAVGEHAARVVGEPAGRDAVMAKPPVRKYARDSGIDLRTVVGTGPGGTITRADVESAVGGVGVAAPSPAPAPARMSTPAAAPAGRASRIPVKGVRRLMAQAMSASAFTAPHVTIWATADVTPTMDLLARLRTLPDFAEVRVSPLLLVARALLLAVRRHPLANSSWDEAAQEIVVKEYVNLGVAAATPRGLTVPNIRDAAVLGLPSLARALHELTDTARAGRTTPADLAGGTISITNVGVLGMDTGTPILNPGEAAILCLGVIRPTPWVHEGAIAIRQVTQLGLSFDHRILDGEAGSAFLRDVAAPLADPTLFTVWG